jgi:soluble P-type ATPase
MLSSSGWMIDSAFGGSLMGKPGIRIKIPYFHDDDPDTTLLITRIVSDYTGTLSFGGRLIPGVEDRLKRLKEIVEHIDVLSADSFGTATEQLAGVPLTPKIYEQNERHNFLKGKHAAENIPIQVVAFGNGNNDELLLKTVKKAGGLAVAVDNGEGCSVHAMKNANIFIVGIVHALDLLLEPRRCIATLRG